MRNIKNTILTIAFVLNTLVFVCYGILDLLEINNLSKLEFILLLVYEIFSFIMFTEVLYEKEKPPKGN
jgi:hypothetical protein